jgi:hypothetical protein
LLFIKLSSKIQTPFFPKAAIKGEKRHEVAYNTFCAKTKKSLYKARRFVLLYFYYFYYFADICGQGDHRVGIYKMRELP